MNVNIDMIGQNGNMLYKLNYYLQLNGFAVIGVSVDDLNLVGTPEELTKTANYLMKDFEMKNLGQNFIANCRSSIYQTGIFIHQSTYTKKILK